MKPSTILASNGSPAERRVFDLLEATDLGDKAVAMHSVNLARHEYKAVSEIDFVVLCPDGLLVCEVKGGRVARAETGLWEFRDRYDRLHTRDEGPWDQARSAMFALKDELSLRLPKTILRQVSFGYCVIFPDVDYDIDAVDAPKELAVDARDIAGAQHLAVPLKRLLAHWRERNRRSGMSGKVLHDVGVALRPSFDLVPSLRVASADIRARLESLTEEQYAGLDWVESQPRLLISGGAGTGKTMLAAEIARREAARGAGVLLTCHSPVLAAFLRTRAASPAVEVAPVSEARERVQASGRFDVVVVDEAQDVFTVDGLGLLDDVVEGGVSGGRWRCLYDLNNQAGIYAPVDLEVLELLRGCEAHQVELRRNCRNTKPVVLQTQAVTGADLGTPLAGEGPAVTYVYPKSDGEEAAMLEHELGRLTREDVLPGDVTILAGSAREASSVALLRPNLGNRIVTLDEATAGRWPFEQLSFARIEDFKGLENDFILVVGLRALAATQADSSRLYVAMSRARTSLWMAVPADLKSEFEELQRANLAGVLAGIGGASDE